MSKDVFYISEINLPSSSAYAIHVMKMCSALSEKNFNTTLFTISHDHKNKDRTFKNYNCSYKFKIIPIYDKRTNLSFFGRIKFALKIYKKINNASLIISRSIITSIIFSILRKKNILELHHAPIGGSKMFFEFSKFFLKIDRYMKIILLHPNILNKIKIKNFDYYIEDDAVDNNDYKELNKNSKYPSNYFLYTGSFFQGKGIEIISKIALKNPKLIFHLYGSKKTLQKSNINPPDNMIFFGEVNYSAIPNILAEYQTVLMPYLRNVKVRSKNLDVGLNMSPLKMFDYLASGKIIVASDLDVYKHVLLDDFNAVLIDPENINEWSFVLNKIAKTPAEFNHLKKNANQTSHIFSWQNRVNRIFNFNI